ncbi:uncharacterized protein N7458_010475 [Penicillium daleae]|uniref:Uncharacterized protein n=1 Tax=Penicillium daleae TaxID=63821 RepID=A0AAD6C0K1_9EURO|nr:uncharacterized protein N7458_010475 [Penicillium daleae]KAJ5439477.1 hypothetical protein N7458_010475 [Penicillium daleae]
MTSFEGREDLLSKELRTHRQDPQAVLLPHTMKTLPNIEELLATGELHVVAIKMKDVAIRPCIGFKSRGVYHAQAEKVHDIEKTLKFSKTIFLLMRSPKKSRYYLVTMLSS